MTNYVRIKNHGQVCQVIGENAHGALMLKNPDGQNFWFHKSAVEPCVDGQYSFCWFCTCPMLITAKPSIYFNHKCCSDHCRSEMRQHYR